MKHLVVDEQLSEGDVHPPEAYDGLVGASVESARIALQQRDQLTVLAQCPACESDQLRSAFEKHGYPYRLCEACQSLFALPRPSATLMHWYLTASPAARFRRDPRFRQSMAARMREEAAYRADWLATLLHADRAPLTGSIAVVGPRSTELLDAVANLPAPRDADTHTARRVLAVAPLPPLLGDADGNGDHRQPTAPTTHQDNAASEATDLGPAAGVARLEDVPAGSCVLVTLMNVIEYAPDPTALLAQAHDALQPGGRLALTTRAGSGFDLQVLGEHANIFPLDHINLPSVEGMRAMLEATGFEVLELSTPGLLDVELVKRNWQQQPERVPRFLGYFLGRDDAQGLERLQAFLQQNRLSSHMRVVARKPRHTRHA